MFLVVCFSGTKRKVGHWQLDGRCVLALPEPSDDYAEEQHCFTLTRGPQKLIIRAESAEQLKEWMDDIKDCCDAAGGALD
jgi:hypothetical protein